MSATKKKQEMRKLQLLSSKDTKQLNSIQTKAKEMGVHDIAFVGNDSKDSLACMKSALDILSEHQESIRASAKRKAEQYSNCKHTV
jgi:uncharacterized Fe-S radical SAM superfamily protein PflX